MTTSTTATAPQLRDTQDAFDSVAADYDGPRGNNILIQEMRTEIREVRSEMSEGFKEMNAALRSMQRTMVYGVVALSASIVTGFGAMAGLLGS